VRYVLDSNVALKWVLRESDSDKARQIRVDYQQQIHELLAPDVFPIEVAHALARSERRGIITPTQGPMFLAGILASQPQLHPYVPLLWRAYAISSQARIGVYDCLYVALAKREGCELVTADDRLVRTLQPTFAFIRSLAALP
jgi:predicted nucleic acid-binding protein